MHSLLGRFNSLYYEFLPVGAKDVDSANHWKEKILYTFIFVAVFLGVAVVILSLPVVLKNKYWAIAVAVCGGYSACLGVFLFPRTNFKIRAWIICLLTYLVGISIIFSVGPFVASREWLFAFSIFASVFLGWTGAVTSIAINTTTYVVIGILLNMGWWQDSMSPLQPLEIWFQVCIDLFFLNVSLAIFVTFLFKKIETSILEAKKNAALLNERQSKLIESKKILEEEIELRKKAQDDFQKTSEMVIQYEKMVSVGGLAAGMAHEINNPLAGMMQNSQLIHQRLKSNIPANQKVAQSLGISMDQVEQYMHKREILRLLENVNMAGGRAAKIVNNMLSFARKDSAVKAAHCLEALLDDTLELAQNDYDLKKKYDFRQVSIKKEYSRDIPVVLCSRSNIQQVVFNLLKNASEALYSENDFKKQRQIILRLYSVQHQVCIEIEDNGPGMDETVRKRIFEPFFTTKDVGVGTGLGLSISYFIVVDSHKGEFDVKSVPGKGACFIIRLPMDNSLEN